MMIYGWILKTGLEKSHHESTIPQLMKYAQQYNEVLTVPSQAAEISVYPEM